MSDFRHQSVQQRKRVGLPPSVHSQWNAESWYGFDEDDAIPHMYIAPHLSSNAERNRPSQIHGSASTAAGRS